MFQRIQSRQSTLARALCGAILFSGTCLAQGTGVIYGTVTDPSGAGIAAAKVEAVLTERGTVRTGTTGAGGDYVFSAMPIGTWAVSVTAAGFQQFRHESVTLDANQNVRIDAALTVGSINQSILVKAEASLVDSRSSMVGTLIDDRRITDLPTNGRNVISLAALLPGASQVSAPQTFTGDRSGPTVSMSGARANFNLFLFDGQDFQAPFRDTGLNYPPPDALQEVKVLTSNFSAEYGHNAGGVFNVVTKSGTNQVHGTLWEFVRNNDFNARNFFALSNPQLAQNQFGAAAGGPLRKDKLFVFASYEGLRIRQGTLATGAFPLTAAERAGDFSGQKAVTDPVGGAAFPNNQIPASRFDTVAQTVLSKGMMPLPNGANGSLIQTFAQPQNNDQGLIRLDYNLSAKHAISGRYNHSYATQIGYGGQVPTYEPLYNAARVQSTTAADTFTVTPAMVNEFRLSHNRFSPVIQPLTGYTLASLGGNFPVLNNEPIPTNIVISGRVTLGVNSSEDAQIENESYQLSDVLNWARGRHFIKAGFEALRRRYLNRSYWQTMGTFNFTGGITNNAAADFLLGKAATATAAAPLLEQSGTQTSFNEFVQDDWRVSPRLTLNLGARYELPLPWVQPQNYWATFHPGQQSTVFPGASPGEVFYGDKGVPRGMVATPTHNFAPRVGFAWDVFGDGRTSIRGGAGIFFNFIQADIIQNSMQPFRYSFTYNTPYSLADPLRGQAPLPLTVNLTNPLFVGVPTIVFPNTGLSTPYVEQFNLSIQREIVGQTLVQAAYVAKLGHKLLQSNEVNPALYAAGATLSNVNARRIIAGWGDMADMESTANSSYHALQVQVNKRFSWHFSLQGAYTFSKAIDQSSSTSPESAAAPQPWNLALERGLSGYNAFHIASLSWLVDLPALQGKTAALRLIAGGWQWNGLFSARSGLPLNPVIGSDVALSGNPNQRPNVVGDWRQPGGRARAAQIAAWLNPAAFATPATGTYGNAGRDIIIGPGSATANVALFKNFTVPFREGMKLQFRSEFFNVLNRVNLGNPNVQVSGGKMGQITSAGDPRVLQFALKLMF